jgi:hypothetical protein
MVHAPRQCGDGRRPGPERGIRCRIARSAAVRYADDFVVLVHGSEDHVYALREDVANVLAPRSRPTQLAWFGQPA